MQQQPGVTQLEPGCCCTPYVALGVKLGLCEQDAADPAKCTAVTRHWLESNAGWLLVFDNAREMRGLLYVTVPF